MLTPMPAFLQLRTEDLLTENPFGPTGFPSLTLGDTLGGLLIGTFIGLFFYGLILYQAYHYAQSYPGDSLRLKGLVALAIFLETVSIGLITHTCYYFLVKDYLHPERLIAGVWSLTLYSTVSGLAMVVSQSFFCARLWLLGPRYRIAVVISCLFSMTELGFFAAVTAKMFTVSLLDDTNTLSVQRAMGFTLAFVADLVLTVVLIYVLHCSRTGLKSTNGMIDVLILYSVSTGLLTGIFDLLTAIFAFARPASYIYGVFAIPGARLYAITLLVVLNFRGTYSTQRSVNLEDSDMVFGMSFSPHAPPDASTSPPNEPRFQALRLHPGVETYGGDIIELKPMAGNTDRSNSGADRKGQELL